MVFDDFKKFTEWVAFIEWVALWSRHWIGDQKLMGLTPSRFAVK